MSKQTTGGFALLEVVVALGVLAISTLVIAQALGAALEYSRAAEAARRATAVAAAIAHTFDERVEYPAGWRVAGGPGPDGLPGTRDDIPPDGPGPRCWSRVVLDTSRWVRVEATCFGGTAPVGDVVGSGSGAVRTGGRLARNVALLRLR